MDFFAPQGFGFAGQPFGDSMTTVQAQPILAEQIVNAIISEIVDGNCG
jgi:hypothetical protein